MSAAANIEAAHGGRGGLVSRAGALRQFFGEKGAAEIGPAGDIRHAQIPTGPGVAYSKLVAELAGAGVDL